MRMCKETDLNVRSENLSIIRVMSMGVEGSLRTESIVPRCGQRVCDTAPAYLTTAGAFLGQANAAKSDTNWT